MSENHEFVDDGNGLCKTCKKTELPRDAEIQAELDMIGEEL